jgi:hypothetical protein
MTWSGFACALSPDISEQVTRTPYFALTSRTRAFCSLEAPIGATSHPLHFRPSSTRCIISASITSLLHHRITPPPPHHSISAFRRTVRAWDATSGSCLYVLEGHSDWVSCVKCAHVVSLLQPVVAFVNGGKLAGTTCYLRLQAKALCRLYRWCFPAVGILI